MWVEPLVFGLFSNNVGLFLNNVGPRPLLFSNNLVPKSPCSRVGAFLFSGRYTYGAIFRSRQDYDSSHLHFGDQLLTK